ncbi:signal transduction histidine kinase [Arthrobacter sp. UYP6]|uniref:sensor histidine kinase n=1 Tax=Arthrobacter sp. UYP6 TaxID=1756378 RepID=UPI0033961EAB
MPAPNHRYSLDGVWESGVASAVGYFAAGSVLMLIGVNGADLVPPIPGAPDWAWAPLLLLGCAGLVFRRRSVPVMLAVTGTATVGSLLLGGGIITYLLLFELFYSGILFGSPRLSRAVQNAAVAGIVILPLAVGLTYRSWADALFGLLQAVLICLIPLWWAGSVRRQSERAEAERQRAETERLRAEHTEELAELNLRMAVTAERGAMARELHDAIAGHLSAVALQSAAALAAGNPDLDRRVLAQVRAESVQALQEMRSMIGLLESDGGPETPSVDTAAGGMEQLEALAASARLAGNPVDLAVEPEIEVPALVGSSAYRIVQESLTNAVRHAPGTLITVRVRQLEGSVDLRISNELPAAPAAGPPAGSPAGLPAGASRGNGTGLRNMFLRAGQLHGSFSAGVTEEVTEPDGPGTRQWVVQALLPAGRAPLQPPAQIQIQEIP